MSVFSRGSRTTVERDQYHAVSTFGPRSVCLIPDAQLGKTSSWVRWCMCMVLDLTALTKVLLSLMDTKLLLRVGQTRDILLAMLLMSLYVPVILHSRAFSFRKREPKWTLMV